MIPADRRLRHRLLLFLTIFSVLGALLVFGLERHLEEVIAASEENPEQAAREVFRLLRLSSIVGGAGLGVFGLYFARFSLRVLSSGRFPPPGTKVIRDTPVQTGAAARLRAWSGIILAILLLVLGFSVPWIPDLVIRPMLHREMQSTEDDAPPSGENLPSAPDSPEHHAFVDPFLPGRSDTGPGPSPVSLSSTPS